jgi:hypothetical protein
MTQEVPLSHCHNLPMADIDDIHQACREAQLLRLRAAIAAAQVALLTHELEQAVAQRRALRAWASELTTRADRDSELS